MEKPDGICSHFFVVVDVFGLFLDPSVFTIKDSKSAGIINGALSDLSVRSVLIQL